MSGNHIHVSFLFLLFITKTVHSQINVWPKPQFLSWPRKQATYIAPTFHIISPIHTYLTPAVTRYTHLILTEHHHPIITPTVKLSPTNPLQTLTLTITDLNSPLQHGVNESYSLTIPTAGSSANLTAETVWGAMRGLETFSQLVWGDPARVATGLYVTDSPIFEHRGVLLDTSRNYYGVEHILRTIEAMSYNKLNVFHWHVVDSHSFPLVLPSEPELAAKGSYGPQMQYTPADVKRVVEFGFQHGVRVMPEIDSPGHTGSWAEAYPDIVTCANMFWGDGFAAEPGTGQLNPLKSKTYKVLKNVIHDVATLFPEIFYHAGVDEVAPGCWETDPSIQKFLANGGTFSQLLEIFVNSTFPYITSLNRTTVYWEDIILGAEVKVDPSLLPPENTIFQTWNNGPNNTKRIVSAGYRAIVSSSNFYYLDCGHGGFVGNDSRYDTLGSVPDNGGSWCGPFQTWQTIYDYDISYGLNETEVELVIGGEVALWSEQADPTVLDARLWPRTSAMAEALWSGNRDENGKKRYADATNRLNEWRYRMVSRGIGAEPIQPLWHTGSWAEAYPDIVTCANMFWLPGTWEDRLAAEPGTGHLNPLNPKTYQVLKNVIHDVTTLFPETFYHGGADEITPGCWKADKTIQTFVANGGTLSHLLETFVNSTLPYITSLNRTVVYWEDVMLDAEVKVDPSLLPPENVILQTWNNGPNNTKRIVSAGYRAIVSSAEFYYLDCGHGDFVGNNSAYDTLGPVLNDGGSWCGPFKTWQTIYDYDITYGLDVAEANLVIGGEVSLWSEQADPTVLDARLWPRTSAFAETMWSGNKDENGKKRYAEATDRLNEWRYRMVSRGIAAEPLQPLWCITHPGMCNLVQ